VPKNRFTLGQYFAYLSYSLESKHNLVDLSVTDLHRVEELRDVYQDQLQNGTSKLEIPKGHCADTPFLHENDRFFVAHLLIKSRKKVNYHSLIRHLNDCHACFSIYSQFFKDYYLMYQELIRTSDG